MDFVVTLLDCRQGDSRGTFTLRFLRLGRSGRTLIMQQSRVVAKVIMALYQPDKLNLAALGNQVSLLHVQHVARFKTDPAWPRPV